MKKAIPFQTVRIEIRPSKMLKGEVGVFAARDLPKDTIVVDVLELKCKKIPWSVFQELDNITKKKVYGYCPGDEKGFCAPPDLNYMSIAWHLNHSCNPNIGFDENENFVAMKNIKKGEELCWDYAYDETNPNFKMKCFCGSNKCRKIVRGDDWKILVERKGISKYLSKKIKRIAHTVVKA